MVKIAVEQTLGHVKSILENNQFEVVDLNLTHQTYVPDISC
jgi:hypothetical protein